MNFTNGHIVILFIVALMSARDAIALTGQELRESCKATMEDNSVDQINLGECAGYIHGINDATEIFALVSSHAFQDYVKRKRGWLCQPDNMTVQQSAAVVVKYLDQHPEEWH